MTNAEGSRYNLHHVDFAMKKLESLVTLFGCENIAIVVPHRAQAAAYRPAVIKASVTESTISDCSASTRANSHRSGVQLTRTSSMLGSLRPTGTKAEKATSSYCKFMVIASSDPFVNIIQ